MNNKKSRDDWQNELIKYRKSGLSVKKYCKENNISPSTFTYWKKKYDFSTPKALPKLVRIASPIKTGERMKLSYNQIIVDFPVEFSVEKIAQLICVLKEV